MIDGQQLDIFRDHKAEEREPQATEASPAGGPIVSTPTGATAEAPSRSSQLTELPGTEWEDIFVG